LLHALDVDHPPRARRVLVRRVGVEDERRGRKREAYLVRDIYASKQRDEIRRRRAEAA
jgi:hypothetical protein